MLMYSVCTVSRLLFTGAQLRLSDFLKGTSLGFEGEDTDN